MFKLVSVPRSNWWKHSCNETDKFLQAIFTISASAIFLLWLLLNFKKSKHSIPPLPPGPRGFPLLGYLPFLSTDLHKSFTELAKAYGPIYKFWLGQKLSVVINSPSLAKEVLRDHDTTFAHRDPPIAARIFTYGGNDIGWCSYGSSWKKMRKVFVSQMLSNASLDSLGFLRKQEVDRTIMYVYDNIGKPLEISELAFMTNINTVMNMLWGGTLEEEAGDKARSVFRHLMPELMELLAKPNVCDLFPAFGRLDLQGVKKKAEKISLSFDKFFDPILESGQKLMEANKSSVEKNKRRKDFLQLLLELNQNENSETSLSMNQIKGMLMDIVVGGTDTTATTVEWTLSELLKYPETMEKVHQELDEVVGLSNLVEEFHLPKLCYLDAVIKETLRLHPPIPTLVPHFASQSCKVGGYTIPKGTTVYVNAYGIHRDPEYWKNPLEFKPDRFLNNNTSRSDFTGNNFQFIPFGSGRRVCAGLALAEKMLRYQLASLLHTFEWKLPDDIKLELSDKFGIVVRKLEPLVVIPTPRLTNLELNQSA